MPFKSLIIVDGYNVIYSSKVLKSLMSSNEKKAREALGEMLFSIYSIESVRVMVVFDSNFENIQIEYPYKDKLFEFIFAPKSLTADGVIEKIILRIKNKASITVVSNDNLVREATRSNGSIVIRPNELFEWVEASNKSLNERSNHTKNPKIIENRINIDLNID